MSSQFKKFSTYLFWGILLASIVLRMVVALILGDQVVVLPGIFDQISYHNLALRVLEGHGFTFETQWWPLTAAGQPTAHWSYLYTLYLVMVYAIFGVHPLAARLIQAVLVGLFTPWLIYRLARRVFPDSPRLNLGPLSIDIPLLAMAWTAFYGYFIYYSAALMTETFYILGILWAFDCAFRNTGKDSKAWNYLELGLALGVTVLLRQIFLIFIPFLFLWLLWSWIGQGASTQVSKMLLQWLTRVAVAVLVLVLMIAPFTWLNYLHFGRFVLLNTNSGYAFFWANHPIHEYNFVAILTPDMPSYQELIPPDLRALDEAALDQELMRLGIGFIRQDPWRYICLSISRFKDQFLFWPLPTSPWISNLVRVGSLGLALPFMILGAIVWLRQSYLRAGQLGVWVALPGFILLLFVLVYDGIHILSWAGIRYRLPTDALLLIYAANGLVVSYLFLRRFITGCRRDTHAPVDI